MSTLSAPLIYISGVLYDVVPVTVLAPDGMTVSEFHEFAFSKAPAGGSLVFPLIVTVMFAPLCTLLFIAENASASVSYSPLRATAPDTTTLPVSAEP